MTGFDHINNIFFLGIGGIGMSALARYFKRAGKNIYGYDLTETPLTKSLENEGMNICYSENTESIPDNIEIVIYTPAVPPQNRIFAHFKNKGVKFYKRAEVLGMISSRYKTIAIAGTHGKTTITALTANMFQKSGTPLVSFIGGMAKNFNGNFVFDENAQIMIAEADEYDRSLLHLKPHSALISTVSPDHLDIYGNLDVLKNTFLEFARSVPGEGNLVINCKLTDLFAERKNLITYGFCKNAMVTATGIEIENQKFKFTINFPGNEKITATMKVPGMHAVENALGVSALAWKMHIGLEDIKRGLESFEGVQRRFDILVNNGDLVIIDDYAHHPDEIDTTLDTARMLFKKKKITVVFQPHLFSRTRDFAEGFARSLDKADNVILLPVYPAREKPLAGVDSYIIFDKMKNKNKIVLEKNMLINELLNNKPEVLILMGAGDIAFLVNGIIKVLA